MHVDLIPPVGRVGVGTVGGRPAVVGHDRAGGPGFGHGYPQAFAFALRGDELTELSQTSIVGFARLVLRHDVLELSAGFDVGGFHSPERLFILDQFGDVAERLKSALVVLLIFGVGGGLVYDLASLGQPLVLLIEQLFESGH